MSSAEKNGTVKPMRWLARVSFVVGMMFAVGACGSVEDFVIGDAGAVGADSGSTDAGERDASGNDGAVSSDSGVPNVDGAMPHDAGRPLPSDPVCESAWLVDGAVGACSGVSAQALGPSPPTSADLAISVLRDDVEQRFWQS